MGLEHISRAAPSADLPEIESLLAVIYGELRKLAEARMAHERPGQTLQPTALVHEAWLRVLNDPHASFRNHAHLFSALAEAMRRILIDRARAKQSVKRGGQLRREPLIDSSVPEPVTSDDILAIHEALDELAEQDKQAAELVKLRYFVGMTTTEAATALDLPLRTAERLWSYAKAWLKRRLTR